MNQNKTIPVFKNDAFRGVIGVAAVDISPPKGIYARSWGAAEHDAAIGLHRPLSLSCITLQSSKAGSPFVLLSADLGVWRSAEVGAAIREQILTRFSIPQSQLMFCLTHTHAGPVLSIDDASKPGGELIERYIATFQVQTLQAVQQALDVAEPAILTWNYGKCMLATNRDLADLQRDRIVTGFNPEKKADDTLLVGRVTNDANKIKATVVNYACHPTTLAWENKLISPDYVGAMREVISRETQAPCLFLQGASGELSPRHQYVEDTAVADQNGREVGYAVLATLENMLPSGKQFVFDRVVHSGAELGVWKLKDSQVSTQLRAENPTVKYALKPLPVLQEIEQLLAQTDDRVAKERLWRQRNLRMALGDGDTTEMGIWLWRVGSALLIGQPNEAYSEFQFQLRAALRGAVAVINLVNGSAGYLAPRACYDQDIYQVWQSPFAAGSLELLYERALSAAEALCV